MGNKAPGISTNTMMFFEYSEQADVMVGIIITPVDTDTLVMMTPEYLWSMEW